MNIIYTILSVLGIAVGSVIGFILLLILILLPMRVRAEVKYDGINGFRLRAGLGPIMLKLFPKNPHKKKKSKKKLPDTEEKVAEKLVENKESSDNSDKNDAKPPKKENGFVRRIKALKVSDYLTLLEKASKHFLSKIYLLFLQNLLRHRL